MSSDNDKNVVDINLLQASYLDKNKLDSILTNLRQTGYCVVDQLFSDQILSGLLSDIVDLKEKFKKSGIGRDSQVQSQIRGDHIFWLDPDHLTQSQKNIFEVLETLKKSFNEHFYLNLKNFEYHLTYYPVGTHYEKHKDSFSGEVAPGVIVKQRKISFVLYLNKEWALEDGGELVLYANEDMPKNNTELLRILPVRGRSIFFLSEEFPHEVLTNHKERFSFTGWMF